MINLVANNKVVDRKNNPKVIIYNLEEFMYNSIANFEELKESVLDLDMSDSER